MTAREPYTEPWTVKERLSIRWTNVKWDLIGWWRSGLWQWLAHRLPRRLALFVFIRVMAYASTRIEDGNRHPDSITYSEAYKEWERKKS